MLEKYGVYVWLEDQKQALEQHIIDQTRIETCNAFIMIMSNQSATSERVLQEFRIAQELDKTIYPILTQGSPWTLIEHFDYFDAQFGIDSLDRVADRIAKYILHVMGISVAEPVKARRVRQWPRLFSEPLFRFAAISIALFSLALILNVMTFNRPRGSFVLSKPIWGNVDGNNDLKSTGLLFSKPLEQKPVLPKLGRLQEASSNTANPFQMSQAVLGFVITVSGGVLAFLLWKIFRLK
jgi:hypothetical protein